MPEGPAAGDGDRHHDGNGDDYQGSDQTDGGNDGDLQDGDLGSSGEGDGLGRGTYAGEGLTEPERELADELERTRGLEAARDRLERLAGDGPDGGGGGSVVDRDALAVIDAAGRFGVDEDTEEASQERAAIAAALALHAIAPPPDPKVHTFPALISKQETRGTSIVLTMRVPWECREVVFNAMETMPFNAVVQMTEIESVDE